MNFLTWPKSDYWVSNIFCLWLFLLTLWAVFQSAFSNSPRTFLWSWPSPLPYLSSHEDKMQKKRKTKFYTFHWFLQKQFQTFYANFFAILQSPKQEHMLLLFRMLQCFETLYVSVKILLWEFLVPRALVAGVLAI